MSWTSIATQFLFTVGSAIAERAGAALSSCIKQEPAKANPVDVAIATKSAVSADREGKIASERAKKPSECSHSRATVQRLEWMQSWLKSCPDCGRYVAADTQANVEELWSRAVMGPIQRNRRLGDYGPSGGG